MTDNTLYYGDNLEVLPQHIKDESVDLIYLDPPFNSKATYNMLFQEQDGTRAAAQIEAFTDTWKWDQGSARTYEAVVEAGGKVSDVMQAVRKFLGGNNMLAYLSMMAPRIKALHQVLKPTGSIYLHCDPTASHYLKLLMDAVFGTKSYRNEIVWQRTNFHDAKGQYGRIHDILLFYTKGETHTWNPLPGLHSAAQLKRYKLDKDGRRYTGQDLTASRPDSDSGKFNWRGTMPSPKRGWGYTIDELEQFWADGLILVKKNGCPRMDGLKVYLDEKQGKPPQSVWTDIRRIGNTSAERLDYPTQKPVELLERIIFISSNPGDVILDPFCGCGTTIDAIEKLNRENADKPLRRWTGIDITQTAIVVIKKRLDDAFGNTCKYVVVGEPVCKEDAAHLAEEDPYQFQWWALGLVGARPVEQNKGSDRSIDGKLVFHDEPTGGDAKQVIFSVKAGHNIHANMVNELLGVLEQEKAQIGVLISMEPPTQPMRATAASAGFYESPGWRTKHPRLQLLTIEELMSGRKIDMPPTRDERTFAKAIRFKPAAKPETPLPFDAKPSK